MVLACDIHTPMADEFFCPSKHLCIEFSSEQDSNSKQKDESDGDEQ